MKFDDSALTSEQLKALADQYQKDPSAAVLARAVNQNGINNVAKDPQAAVRTNRVFSVEVKTGKATNQRQSGRCWLYSLTNNLRQTFASQYKVKDFELSQSYLFFWDKIERANIFYDRMIATASRPTTDREVAFYLAGPGGDGGQWAMAAALVQKYGVMPVSEFPESNVTKNTRDFDNVMDLKLRRDGMRLRRLVQANADDEEIEKTRHQMLSEVYRITAMSVGTPPKTFNFEYRDDDHKYHIDKDLTPQAFYQKYFNVDLDNYVVLSNSPDKPFNKTYRLASQENVVGGKQIKFLNVPLADFKQAAIKQLKGGETIWFANDVVQQSDRQAGILDSNLYRRDRLFNVDLTMSKAERLKYHEACVSHAMVLTGVDLVDDQPTRWKVENSWGDKPGKKGYFTMDDSWMDDYVYEIAINKKYLTDDQVKAAEQAPQALEPWDSLQ